MAASTTMTYTILTGEKSVEGSIRYWANHVNLPAGQVLERAQRWTFHRLRVREMISVATLTPGDGDSTIDLSTDVDGFQQPIQLSVDGYGILEYKREEDFPRWRDTDNALSEGHPTCWTIIGQTIYFDSELTETLTMRLYYYGTPDLLAASTNETNFLTDRYPDVLHHAIMARIYAAQHRDADRKTEEQLARNAIAEANMDDDTFRHGQGL